MYHSQFGEDRILAGIFHDTLRGCCVEVGANDGRHGSTTLYFEENGWDCVLIEPNAELCRQLRTHRVGQVFECAASDAEGTATLQVAEGGAFAHSLSTISEAPDAKRTIKRHGFGTRPVAVRTRRLDNILAEAGLSQIEFLSIDVEGHELSVLRGFSLERWQPRILIIEDNSFLGRSQVQRHLREHGYVRFHRTGVNDWYAHRQNRALAGRAGGLHYYRALAIGRAWILRIWAAHLIKKIPGTERAYRAVKRSLS
jgi:FkbM family methyltransferase